MERGFSHHTWFYSTIPASLQWTVIHKISVFLSQIVPLFIFKGWHTELEKNYVMPRNQLLQNPIDQEKGRKQRFIHSFIETLPNPISSSNTLHVSILYHCITHYNVQTREHFFFLGNGSRSWPQKRTWIFQHASNCNHQKGINPSPLPSLINHSCDANKSIATCGNMFYSVNNLTKRSIMYFATAIKRLSIKLMQVLIMSV